MLWKSNIWSSYWSDHSSRFGHVAGSPTTCEDLTLAHCFTDWMYSNSVGFCSNLSRCAFVQPWFRRRRIHRLSKQIVLFYVLTSSTYFKNIHTHMRLKSILFGNYCEARLCMTDDRSLTYKINFIYITSIQTDRLFCSSSTPCIFLSKLTWIIIISFIACG